MRELESLTEQALNEDICAVIPSDRFAEYQHPEDPEENLMDLFQRYDKEIPVGDKSYPQHRPERHLPGEIIQHQRNGFA